MFSLRSHHNFSLVGIGASVALVSAVALASVSPSRNFLISGAAVAALFILISWLSVVSARNNTVTRFTLLLFGSRRNQASRLGLLRDSENHFKAAKSLLP